MRLAGYTRVSTSNQVEGTSLQTQEDNIRLYCKMHEHELVHIFSDKGLSGKAGTHRPQYENMLKRLESDRGVEGVIIYSLSRLGRSTAEVIAFVHHLSGEGRVLISIKENFDMTTKEGRMLFSMMASFNEYERELIAERVAEGRAYAEVHGTKSGKPCHRPEKNINWEKVERLREQGLSWTMIARVLSSEPEGKVSYQTLIARARKRGMKVD